MGRNGSDGLTEVVHVDCFPDLPARFTEAWNQAPRLPRDQASPVSFDPAEVTPRGFQIVGDPWVQHPQMDPTSYGANVCNALCLRDVPASEALDVLETAWLEGVSNMRRELWQTYGNRVLNRNLKPTPGAKGSGGSSKNQVASNLKAMAQDPKVKVLLLSIRKPGRLYAFTENREPILKE